MNHFSNLKFHQLFYSTVLFIIFLTIFSFFNSLFFFVISFFCIITVSYFFWTKKLAFSIFLATIFSCIGAYRYWQTIKNYENFYTITANQKCSIKGTIHSIDSIQHLPFKQLTTIKINELQIADKSFAADNYIAIYSQKISDIRIADTVRISDLIFKKNKSEKFNFYLMKENIDAVLFENNAKYVLIERPRFSINRTIFEYKVYLLDSFKRKLSKSSYNLFSSLFLGKAEKSNHNDTVKNEFLCWGLSHYLARSGLHLIIVLFLWQFLLQFAPIHIFYKNILVLAIITTYSLLSWSSISFYRALLSLFFFKGFSLMLIPVKTVHIFVLVCLIALIYNPFYLFSLDFQLSFFITFTLILYNKLMNNSQIS